MLVGLGLSNPLVAADTIPPAVDRFSKETQEVPHFQRHVLPLMGRLGCNGRACHGSFQGQGGFRLSLFGYDFKMDHDALVAGDNPRVDLKNIDKSLMLDKPSSDEQDFHGGGKRMAKNSWEYRLLKRWVEAGAKSVDQAADPQFVRLEVTPLETVFGKVGETTQMKVLSHWSDGTVEDVTCLCRFTTNDDAVAKVDLGGKITIIGKGDTHIVAFYDNGVVPVSVLLPVSDKANENYPKVATPTKVDELVVNKLRKLGVVPSEVCSDTDFLRRASLDMTGALPTSDEVRAFLADNSADKRARKVDELLSRPAYAAWWATKLCDILGNSENQIRRNYGVGSPYEQWYQWVNRQVAKNVHYDDLVEGVVLSVSRSSDEQKFIDYCKEMNAFGLGEKEYADRDTMPWYWARQNMRKSSEKALSFSYAFLGVRLQCAECHKHPFDQWSQQDFQQFTAFFNRVNYGPRERDEIQKMLTSLGAADKKLGNNEKQKILTAAAKDGKVIPYDEVYITPASKTSRGRKDKEKVASNGSRVLTPKVLGGEELVDASYEDPREPLMNWLRDKNNPYFARAFVNRVWSNYFNVGIVEPADDMNLANAPSNKELLDWLAAAFIENDYDMKWLHRTIALSDTYQRSWTTNETNEVDIKNFSHMVPRRLQAEAVYDAVITATAGGAELTKRADDPVANCAIGLSKGYTVRGGGGTYALNVFGKPKRETPCDCERSNEPSLLQTVYLRNDGELFRTLERSNGWLAELNKAVAKAGQPEVKTDAKKLAAEISELERNIVRANRKDRKDEVAKLKKELATLQQRLKGGKDKSSDKPVTAPPTVAKMVEEAYLRTFSRLPSKDELASAEKYIADSADQSSGVRDLVWALINSKEFLVNH
jgi:hypothetical protein